MLFRSNHLQTPSIKPSPESTSIYLPKEATESAFVNVDPPCRTAMSSASRHRFRGRGAAVRRQADLPVAPQVGAHLRASRVPSGLRVGASGYGPWRKRRMMECSGHLLRHHRPCRRLRSTRSPMVTTTMTTTSPSPPGCGGRRRASLRPHPSLARPREHPPGRHRHRAPTARRGPLPGLLLPRGPPSFLQQRQHHLQPVRRQQQLERRLHQTRRRGPPPPPPRDSPRPKDGGLFSAVAGNPSKFPPLSCIDLP